MIFGISTPFVEFYQLLKLMSELSKRPVYFGNFCSRNHLQNALIQILFYNESYLSGFFLNLRQTSVFTFRGEFHVSVVPNVPTFSGGGEFYIILLGCQPSREWRAFLTSATFILKFFCFQNIFWKKSWFELQLKSIPVFLKLLYIKIIFLFRIFGIFCVQ